MVSPRVRVFRVLALVAFFVGLATLGAHLSMRGLLLRTELTWVVYGIAGGGALGAVAAFAEQGHDGSRRTSRLAVLAFALNGLLVAGTYLSTAVVVELPPSSFAMDVGETAPEFVVGPLDAEGRRVHLADVRGKPVVLVFHRGGWCPFCQAELARLDAHRAELLPLASVLAISVDMPDAVRAYARANDLGIELLHDENAAVTRQYGLTFEQPGKGHVPIPATIVLDAKGRIAWHHVATNVRDRPEPAEILRVLRRLS